jgi:endonuclease/exonuclease/phosphatase (EEP) superfamily protein YafD
MSRWPKTSDHAAHDDCTDQIRGNRPKKSWSFRSRVSLAFTCLFALLALAVSVDWFGWIGELVSAMGWRIALIGFILSAMQWVVRHRRSAAITAAASCVMLLPMLLLSPRAPQASASSQGQHVRLFIANVHALNKTPDKLLEMLSGSDADILILTEPPPPVMKALRPNGVLSQPFPFVARTKPDRGTHAWLVVASRMPLIQETGATPGMNPVLVTVAGKEIGLVATHLISPRTPDRYRQARVQVQALASQAKSFKARNLPMILAGDLNAPPGSLRSRRLTRITGTRRSKPREVLAGSWPTLLPRWTALPIDGAMLSPGIEVEQWTLVDLPGSDHRGLRIDLIVPRPDSDALPHQSGSSPPNP